MVKFFSRAEIEVQRWDEVIDKSECARPYLFSWYLDLVCPSWGALINEDYSLLAPIPLKQKFLINYAFQPKWVQQLGFFGKKINDIDERVLESHFKKLPSSVGLLNFNLNPCHNTGKDSLNNYELDLNKDYQTLRSQYKGNLRNCINKASKDDLKIRKDDEPLPLIKTFQEHAAHKFNTFSSHDYRALERIIGEAILRSKGTLRTVYNKDEQLLGGAFFLESETFSVFLFSAVNEEGRKKNVMHWLIDKFIRERAGQNRILDFEGGNSRGTALFFKSFGAVNVPFPTIKWYRFPLIKTNIKR